MNIVNKVPWITHRELHLLKANASLPFSLGPFPSLDAILSTLGVDVILEPVNDNATHLTLIQGDPEQGIKMCAYYDSRIKAICIYLNELRERYDNQPLDELLVATLAHETMHVYFGRKGSERFPYAIHVEEPLAEFGMLLFLHETKSSYFQFILNRVRNKKGCYRYGAMLMDQHLVSGPQSAERQYLENYPVRLNPSAVLTKRNGILHFPSELSPSNPTDFDELGSRPLWEDLFAYPPRFYFDESSQTLFLDGHWRDVLIHHKGVTIINGKAHLYSSDIKRLYLGDHFFTDDIRHAYPICLCPVYVSPLNGVYAEVNHIPVYRKDNKPLLPSCGKGLYALCRNGKWGAIDESLNQVLPFIYDGLGSFGRNSLMRVSIRQDDGRLLYGMINLQGEAQVPVAYDAVRINPNGTYTVTKDGKKQSIDKYGNRITTPKVSPGNADVPVRKQLNC
jgi:hypothetical protein